MFVIASAILPRYLGVGVLITVWGAVVMFLAPVFRDKGANSGSAAKSPNRVRKTIFWSGLAGLFGLVLFFVKLPFVVVVPMTLDVANQYQVTVSSSGALEEMAPYADIEPSDTIARLTNPYLFEQLRALQSEIEIANQILSSVQGVDPVQTLAADEQVSSLRDRLGVLSREVGGLDVLAKEKGVFVPSGLNVGQWVDAGTSIGALYPVAGSAVLSGEFPEAHVDTWASPLAKANLRVGKEDYENVDYSQLELREIMSLDAESGKRSWSIFLTTKQPAATYVGTMADLRLSFAAVPIKDHIAFHWNRAVERFREAQLADRVSYLD